MQQQYDNTNRGALFENDRKESERHPDVKGKINIAGVEHWLDGWWKDTQRGRVLSLSLGKPCNETQTRNAAPARPASQPQRQAAPARPAPAPRQQSAPRPAAPVYNTPPSGFETMDDDCPF